jgi:uncharacterized protein
MTERRFEEHTLQERHLAHLDGLRERGVLRANGPFRDQDDEMLRGICVFGASPEVARRLMADDPMVRARRLEAVVATWLAPEGDVRFPGS